jgi:hypothetical protein
MTKDKSYRKLPKWLYFYLCIAFSLGTVQVGATINFDENAFIYGRDFPGGPLGWITTHFNFAHAVSVVAVFLQDAMLVSMK